MARYNLSYLVTYEMIVSIVQQILDAFVITRVFAPVSKSVQVYLSNIWNQGKQEKNMISPITFPVPESSRTPYAKQGFRSKILPKPAKS
jgi:hypothetical protein